MYRVASEELLMQYRDNPEELALIFREFILQGVDPNPSLQGITVTGGRLNALNPIISVLEMSDPSKVSMPRLSHSAGIYFEPFAVTISNHTENTQFFYTIDGSEPSSSNGTLYTTPIEVRSNLTLRVIGYVTGLTPSNITTEGSSSAQMIIISRLH
jgi:hypothetical protein